jgi:hypothetical protein
VHSAATNQEVAFDDDDDHSFAASSSAGGLKAKRWTEEEYTQDNGRTRRNMPSPRPRPFLVKAGGPAVMILRQSWLLLSISIRADQSKTNLRPSSGDSIKVLKVSDSPWTLRSGAADAFIPSSSPMLVTLTPSWPLRNPPKPRCSSCQAPESFRELCE